MDVVCKLELKERGVPGGDGTAIIPDRRPADRLKMVPKMDLHFYMIWGPFRGSKMAKSLCKK